MNNNYKFKLYTIGCPKCNILYKKLLAKYSYLNLDELNKLLTLCSDEEEMIENGISMLPVLRVYDLNGNITMDLEFDDAIEFIKKL